MLSCLLVLAGWALVGCSGPVRIEPDDMGDLRGADRAACEAFVDDLPGELADQEPRELDPADALGAAYGDPPIVVTCVTATPDGFDEFAACEQVNDVGWFIPDDQVVDPDADVVLSAMSYWPIIQVKVPADYRPDGAAAVLAQLAQPIKDHLELVDECL